MDVGARHAVPVLTPVASRLVPYPEEFNMRIAHYLNQFFGGIGAEEHAGKGLEVRDSAVGPGRLLESLLGNDARIVLTLVCGDNYAVEHQEEITASVMAKVRQANVDLFVAGPCFDAGRYGMAAGALCRAVQAELSISAVTAMSEENPGVDLYRDALYIIDSGTTIANMRNVLDKMARLSRKLVTKEPIGLPHEEGYLRRGWLRDQLVEKKAATRLVDMLLAKMNGEPFDSEMPPTAFAPIRIRSKEQQRRVGGLTALKDAMICALKTTKFPTAATTRGSSRKILTDWCLSMPCAKWKKTAS